MKTVEVGSRVYVYYSNLKLFFLEGEYKILGEDSRNLFNKSSMGVIPKKCQ